MEIDAALIAQTGKEFVNYNGASGPRRGLLTIYGSVSSYLTPYRVQCGVQQRGTTAASAEAPTRTTPSCCTSRRRAFPTVGSYQILEWQELPSTMEVET